VSFTIRPEGDSKYFEVGEPLCLYTTFPVRQCMHCQLKPAPPNKPPVVVTAIDHEAGIVTFGVKK
jgi:hypothetical protein